MSRKGNSMDNGLMENFFGLLKTEMFYDWEDQYQTLDDLEAAIENYIYYYNPCFSLLKISLESISYFKYT